MREAALRKFWSRLKSGRPDSSKATTSSSMMVFSGRSLKASTIRGNCLLKDLLCRE